jgi:hypothetical protein
VLFADRIYTSSLKIINLVAISRFKWSKNYYIIRLELVGGRYERGDNIK